MDQSTLVDDRIGDGRRLVERFAADGNPVLAAFWATTAEEGLWFLYIVTDLIDRVGPAGAYRALAESARKLGDSWGSTSEVKVVSPKNRIAKEILDEIARHPERPRFGGSSLGSIAVEQTYVYPARVYAFAAANPMTTEEIGREILALMNRGPSSRETSQVLLKDGDTFRGVPFSLQKGRDNVLLAQFIAEGEAAPRILRLDEIASIR